MEVSESIGRLEVSCERCKVLLANEVRWREHANRQLIRSSLDDKFMEIEKYLGHHGPKIDKSKCWIQYGMMSRYVNSVNEGLSKYSTELDDLWIRLTQFDELHGERPRWLHRYRAADRGGIQYASSGKRFGQVFSERRYYFQDSRLDALVEEIKARAPASSQDETYDPKAEPAVLLVHGQPLVGMSALCFQALEALESLDESPFFPDGCVYLPMKAGGTEMEFAELVLKYLLKCVPEQCRYIPESNGPTLLKDVVDHFGCVVQNRRCIFLLDDVWPKRCGDDGVRWEGNPLDDIVRELASPDSLVLVCSSNRGAVGVGKYESAGELYRVPLAERALMREVFREAWDQKAHISSKALKFDNLSDQWVAAVERVLDSSGGLPGVAAAASTAIFRRR